MENSSLDRDAAVDVVTALEEALARTAAVVYEIRTPDLGRPTPCSDWTMRDLLNHVVAVTVRFTSFAEGDHAPRMPSGDLLGDAPVKAYEEASGRSVIAWRANPEALDRTCQLSFGRFGGRTAAAINAFDAPIWFLWKDGAFYMTSVEGKSQLRNLQRDPRAGICVDLEGPDEGGFRPNRQVKAKGTVRLFDDDGTWTRRITLKYVSGIEGERTAEARARMPRLVIELRPQRVVRLAAH